MDIISETVSDDADLRKKLYAEYTGHALIVSKATDEKAETVYKNYYDYSELACKIPRTDFSHLTEENVRMRSRSALNRKNSML